MRALGIDAFRFSIAWPRILPDGGGRVNQAGLDFYDRLVDALLAARDRAARRRSTTGICRSRSRMRAAGPARDDRRGVRATTRRSSPTGSAIASTTGSRHNEPCVVAWLGYGRGEHAPGRARSAADALAAAHHLLLSHGLATSTCCAATSPGAAVGIALNLSTVAPATRRRRRPGRRADGRRRSRTAGSSTRSSAARTRPTCWSSFAAHAPPVEDGDLRAIAAPLDFLGVNYYHAAVVGAGRRTAEPSRAARLAATPTWAGGLADGLSDLLVRLRDDYAPAGDRRHRERHVLRRRPRARRHGQGPGAASPTSQTHLAAVGARSRRGRAGRRASSSGRCSITPDRPPTEARAALRTLRRRGPRVRRHAAGHAAAVAELPRRRGAVRPLHEHRGRLHVLARRATAPADPLPLQRHAARLGRPLPLRQRRRHGLEPGLEADEDAARPVRVPPRPRLHAHRRRARRRRGRAPLLRPAGRDRGDLEDDRPQHRAGREGRDALLLRRVLLLRGAERHDELPAHVLGRRGRGRGVGASTTRRSTASGGTTTRVFGCTRETSGFDTSRDAFVGVHNGLHEAAVPFGGLAHRSIAHGWNPIGSHQLDLQLEPGAEETFAFVLGYVDQGDAPKFERPSVMNKDKGRALLARYAEPGRGRRGVRRAAGRAGSTSSPASRSSAPIRTRSGC